MRFHRSTRDSDILGRDRIPHPAVQRNHFNEIVVPSRIQI
jgi:hypothetical protein